MGVLYPSERERENSLSRETHLAERICDWQFETMWPLKVQRKDRRDTTVLWILPRLGLEAWLD